MGLNGYTCIHSAPIISPLSCLKPRNTSLLDALKSCLMQGAKMKAQLYFFSTPSAVGNRRLGVELSEIGFAFDGNVLEKLPSLLD